MSKGWRRGARDEKKRGKRAQSGRMTEGKRKTKSRRQRRVNGRTNETRKQRERGRSG